MKQIILFSLMIATVMCSSKFLATEYTYPSQNIITFRLDDNFKTNATLNQLGKVPMQVGLYYMETYFTSPQCVNCQIYSDKTSKPFLCNQEDYCTQYQEIRGTVDSYFKASGSLINMNLVLESTEFYLSYGMYVQWISQLQPNQIYHYQGIGLGLTRAVQSSIIRSLYQQAKIDEYSYSLYYLGGSYNLILGGYNETLLAQEFYNIKSADIMRNIPYKISDDLVLGDLYYNSQPILKDAQILLDPTIDGIILPSKYYNQYNIQTILQNQRRVPDISQYTPDSPGIWSSLKSAPSFTVSFQLDDPDAISQHLQVNFDAQTFNTKNSKGQFSPRMSFSNIQDENNQLDNVVRVGKILFQQMMFYKQIKGVGSNPIEQRLLAPLISK